jgi:hypothetical protein
MNEDIATLWNVSAKFEETAFHHTVLCAFETVPTKYSSGNILSRRSKVVSINSIWYINHGKPTDAGCM